MVPRLEKIPFFLGTQIKIYLQYCLFSLQFFTYKFFILEVKFPSKCQNFLETCSRVPYFFPGMDGAKFNSHDWRFKSSF